VRVCERKTKQGENVKLQGSSRWPRVRGGQFPLIFSIKQGPLLPASSHSIERAGERKKRQRAGEGEPRETGSCSPLCLRTREGETRGEEEKKEKKRGCSLAQSKLREERRRRREKREGEGKRVVPLLSPNREKKEGEEERKEKEKERGLILA
jgi:hypothetical protein